MMRILFITLLISAITPAYAGWCERSWTATITDEVRVNSNGKKLMTIGQVLSQERYHFYIQLMPDQIDKIRGEEYWQPTGYPLNDVYYLKEYRRILTEISGEKFKLSDKVRKAFWECPKIDVSVVKTGGDCQAEATSSVEITAGNIDHCFVK
jgi:hypothetical protein